MTRTSVGFRCVHDSTWVVMDHIRPPRRHHWLLSICRTLPLRQNLSWRRKKICLTWLQLAWRRHGCKSLASQVLFQELKKVEFTGCEVGAVGTVIRNLPSVPPLRIAASAYCFAAIKSTPFCVCSRGWNSSDIYLKHPLWPWVMIRFADSTLRCSKYHMTCFTVRP